ncbi:MAG: UDP-2,3-diacylglucosamine diphosphatase LpxI [Planctomycetota bacterium]
MGGDPQATNSVDGRLRRPPERVGLIAGWGRLPIVVAEALRRQGSRVYCLGAWGHADPCLKDVCDEFRWSGLAKFGRAVRYFKRHGVTDAVMAGKIHKRFMFQPWFMIRQLPDVRTIRAFLPHFLTRRKDCKDDSLSNVAVDLFEAEGIRIGPATDYAPELLVRRGPLTERSPSSGQLKDIRFGWEMAKEMGRLDVGQSVAVKNLAVLAVEAVEGTDECIRRAGQLCRAGGFTVVKVAKPQQDMRFDVPTVGLGTLQTMLDAGARVLAIEAGKTIVLDQEKVVDFANRNKLIVVALEDPAPRRDDEPSSAEANH